MLPAASLQYSVLRFFDFVHSLGNRPDLEGPIASSPGLSAELDPDRAVVADPAVVSFEPAIVVIVPLVHDAVADDGILTVAELVRLVLAHWFPVALEGLTVRLDVRLKGGIFQVAFHPEYATRPLLFVAGASPCIAVYKSVWTSAEIKDRGRNDSRGSTSSFCSRASWRRSEDRSASASVRLR